MKKFTITILAITLAFIVVPSLLTAEAPVVDGDLITTADSSDVFIAKIVGAKKFKRLILNPEIFNSYNHFTWNRIKEVDSSTFNDFLVSSLVRKDGDAKIYYLSSVMNTDNGVKQLIPTDSDFIGHGFDRDAIYTINDLEHALYVAGKDYKAEISPPIKGLDFDSYFDSHAPKWHEALPKTPAENSRVDEYLDELGWDKASALAVAKKVRNSTVCILHTATSSSCSTGVVIAPDIIATCSHCIYEGEDPTAVIDFFVKTIDGRIFRATPLAQPPGAVDGVDLAVARVHIGVDVLPPPLPIAQSTARLGDPVIIVGHPSGMHGGWIPVIGEVEFIGDENKLGIRSFHIYASSRSGNSGSPIANKHGAIISVFTGSTTRNSPLYGEATAPYPFGLYLSLDATRDKVATGIYGRVFYEFFKQYAAK